MKAREWTELALQAEAIKRREVEAKGICPDSGLALTVCRDSICDCFRWVGTE